jgi:hypothetical protein
LLLRGAMKGAFLLAAVLGSSTGCTELLYETPTAPPPGTERACESRNARGLCTHWEPHETTDARWVRETTEEREREEAYRKGEPFLPSDVPGESAEQSVARIVEEHRRQEAYQKGEPFFPEHRPGETSMQYVNRMDEERRRQEAYRKNEPFFPQTTPR